MTVGGPGEVRMPPVRVKSDIYSDLNQLLLVKHQVQFQTNLLQAALNLYVKARMQKLEQVGKEVLQQQMQMPSGDRVGMTEEQVLHLATGGEGKVDEEALFAKEMQHLLGRPLDKAAQKKFQKFLDMRRALYQMQKQQAKMAQDPLGPRSQQSLRGGEKYEPAKEPPLPEEGFPAEGEGKLQKGMLDDKAAEALKDANPSAPPDPPLPPPDWQSDPAAWTIWLLNWLVTSKVLPGAYAQVEMYAQLANLHNKQMNAMQYIQYMLQRAGRNNTPFGPTKPTNWGPYFRKKSGPWEKSSWWKNHGSIISFLYRDIKPIMQAVESAEQDMQMFKSDPSVYAHFKAIFSDLIGAVGPKGRIMGGSFWHFMTRVVSAYHNGWQALFKDNGTDFQAQLYEFAHIAYAKEFITQGTKAVKNTWWDQAINNFGNSGPWANVLDDFKQLSNVLTNKSTQDETNLRVAFLSLSTKINACSDLLTTTGQMLSAIAQNLRSSA